MKRKWDGEIEGEEGGKCKKEERERETDSERKGQREREAAREVKEERREMYKVMEGERQRERGKDKWEREREGWKGRSVTKTPNNKKFWSSSVSGCKHTEILLYLYFLTHFSKWEHEKSWAKYQKQSHILIKGVPVDTLLMYCLVMFEIWTARMYSGCRAMSPSSFKKVLMKDVGSRTKMSCFDMNFWILTNPAFKHHKSHIVCNGWFSNKRGGGQIRWINIRHPNISSYKKGRASSFLKTVLQKMYWL